MPAKRKSRGSKRRSTKRRSTKRKSRGSKKAVSGKPTLAQTRKYLASRKLSSVAGAKAGKHTKKVDFMKNKSKVVLNQSAGTHRIRAHVTINGVKYNTPLEFKHKANIENIVGKSFSTVAPKSKKGKRKSLTKCKKICDNKKGKKVACKKSCTKRYSAKRKSTKRKSTKRKSTKRKSKRRSTKRRSRK